MNIRQYHQQNIDSSTNEDDDDDDDDCGDGSCNKNSHDKYQEH